MMCPNCNVNLVMSERQGVEIDYCPNCRGVWLDVARWNPQSSAFELEWKSTWWRWAESEGGDGRLKKADVWHFTRRTLTAVKEEIAIPLLERASA